MAETEHSIEVRGVLLPINSGKLLLPNASISEVVNYSQPEPLEGDKQVVTGELIMAGAASSSSLF